MTDGFAHLFPASREIAALSAEEAFAASGSIAGSIIRAPVRRSTSSATSSPFRRAPACPIC